VPLGTQASLPVLPIDALPSWIGEQVCAVAEFTQTSPDMAATMALAALSTAASGRVHVRIRDGWNGSRGRPCAPHTPGQKTVNSRAGSSARLAGWPA
jgi:hypothetical protein